MLLYALTISLSAFLLFEVQPIIAKTILPWFGGSSAVWSTCMLFFQVVLLLGYAYAHWLHSRLAARTQAMVHIAVLAAAFAAERQSSRATSMANLLAYYIDTARLHFIALSASLCSDSASRF